MIVKNSTINNLVASSISSGIALITNIRSSDISTSNSVISPNIITTNMSTGNILVTNLLATNFTLPNIVYSNITTSDLMTTNLVAVNSSLTNLLSTNITAPNILTTNLTAGSARIFSSVTQGSTQLLVASANITNGSQVGTLLGKNADVANGLYTWYEHVGDNNTSNHVHYDFNGANNTLVLNAQGRVGMGTNVPSDKLHVAGTLRVNTSITTPNLIATNMSIDNLCSTNSYSISAYASTLMSAANMSTAVATVSNLISTNVSTNQLRVNSTTITNGSIILDNNIGGGVIHFSDLHHSIWGRKGANGEIDVMQFREFGEIQFWNGGILTDQTLKMSITNNGVVSVANLSTTNITVNSLYLPITSDVPAIDPNMTNTLIVYEDFTGTNLRSGTTAGNDVIYIQNTGTNNGYLRLTTNVNSQYGALYWKINPGNAFSLTFDHYAGGGNGADAIDFRWGNSAFNTSEGYTIEFDEYNDRIRLLFNNNQLATYTVNNLDNQVWHRSTVSFYRNQIRLVYDGTMVINYQDTTRNVNGAFMTFYGRTGGLNNYHRIRHIRMTKLTESLWQYQENTSGNIVYQGGDVGIGTSVPSNTLHVGGTLRVNTSITTPSIVTTNISTNALIAVGNSNTIGSVFTTGGNVGVGTTNPGYRLDISANSIGDVMKISNVNTSAYGSIVYVGDQLSWYGGIGNSAAGDTDLRNAFFILGGSGSTAYFVGKTTGNWGINTKTPTNNLHVAGTMRVDTLITTQNVLTTSLTTGTLRVNSLSVTDGNMVLDNNVGGGVLHFSDPHHAIWGRKGADGAMDVMQIREFGEIQFWNGGLLNTQTNRMTIKMTGNVGIGTSTPGSILHVSNSSLTNINGTDVVFTVGGPEDTA
jgi:hypothetical protein